MTDEPTIHSLTRGEHRPLLNAAAIESLLYLAEMVEALGHPEQAEAYMLEAQRLAEQGGAK